MAIGAVPPGRMKSRIIAIRTDRSRLQDLFAALEDVSQVSTCTTIGEAVELLKDRPYNAAIVDLDEPQGRESVAAIRETPACADLPILGATKESQLRPETSLEADLVATNVSTVDQLSAALRAVLGDQDDLYDMARVYDPSATLLVDDPVCMWVKSRLGILGSTRIHRRVSNSLIAPLLDARVAFCHQLIDDLPMDRVRTEDLWNLVLFLAVPWVEDEVREVPEVGLALLRLATMMSGSRKVILWSGMRINDELGPVGVGSFRWVPSTQDPLREALLLGARDAYERQLVDMFFKKRIPEDDIEALIRILGRARR